MSGINQKEYLKKYLGIGKGPGDKKKKKKTKKLGSGLKIVDDDVDIRLNEEIQVDLTAENDEAPQIVSVIDDRPPSLRIDEATRSNLWKPIGAPDESEQVEGSIKFEGNIQFSKLGSKHTSLHNKKVSSPSRKDQGSKKGSRKNSASIHKELSLPLSQVSSQTDKNNMASSEHDFSPIRQHRNKNILLPGKGKAQVDSDSDNSPPRKKHTDVSKERNGDSDNSPPRKRSDGTSTLQRRKSKDMSPRRTKTDGDSSPPRRSKTKTKEDLSPPMKRKDVAEDYSPPRMIKREISEDTSPPRRRRGADTDSSPPRRIKTEKNEDNSPLRRKKGTEPNSSSPRMSKRIHEDNSPSRRRNDRSPGRKKSRWGNSEETSEKMKKTLDGKVAGLQSAAALLKETEELKRRDDELFKNLSLEVSGANATTIIRKKNKEVDLEEEERKRKVEEENKEKYNRWGKGLKQVDDVNERIKNDLYEMSKPLARYADDEDLERHLKDQEREGDPMLAYIRQKKRKKAVDLGAPEIQQYAGDAPPNRFGIRPGYRWDGVDRSSGYEKKWFEVQNSRKASMEENYKWSTEDM